MAYIDLQTVNRPQVYKNEDENLQRKVLNGVYETLTGLLESMPKSERLEDEQIEKVRRHDAIFIDGERGMGKTVLMINIEENYKRKTEARERSLYFIGPVDPTLLYDNEDFLGVVLGSVVEAVEKEKERMGGAVDETTFMQYHKALERVSLSLGAVMKLKHASMLEGGIDAIAANASSKALEQHVHLFFKETANLLKVQALVLLIDDVDMAFKKGFDVLEVVRKFLASPYIVPIVSGDGKLYKKLLCNQFRRDIACNERNCDTKEPMVDDIVNQYFNKVLPNDYRYTIEPIDKIEPQIRNGKDVVVDYKDLHDYANELIYHYMRRKKDAIAIFPNDNVRSFVQLAAKLKPVVMAMEGQKNKESFYTALVKEGALYRQFLEGVEEFYRYATDKQKYLLSLACRNDLEAFEEQDGRGRIDGYKALEGPLFQGKHIAMFQCSNEENSDAGETQNLIAFPKEKLVHGLYFRKPDTSEGEREDTVDTLDRFIASLFSHSGEFRTGNATRRYVFVGKFVSFMLLSLSGIRNKEERKEKVMEILLDPPYQSDFTLDEFDYNKEDEEETDFGIKKDDLEEKEIQKLLSYSDDTVLPSPNSYALYLMLKKFYTDWNVFKEKYMVGKTTRDDGQSKELLQRIVYIFLNSIGYYETPAHASGVRIAMTEKIFKTQNIKSSEAYKHNLKWALETKDKNDKMEKESLVGFFYDHPLIQAILEKEGAEKPKFPFFIGEKSSELKKKTESRSKSSEDKNKIEKSTEEEQR